MNELMYKSYKANDDLTVIPLYRIDEDRALFITTDMSPTPFVSWTFRVINDDRIDLCYGNYYETLKDAIIGENITFDKDKTKFDTIKELQEWLATQTKLLENPDLEPTEHSRICDIIDVTFTKNNHLIDKVLSKTSTDENFGLAEIIDEVEKL